jgi:hypothetical protein
MYGAYGQPLPPNTHAEAYAQPPPRGQQQYLPSPTGTTGPYSAHSAHSPSSESYDDGSRDAGRKRLHPEPHTPTLPQPNPASASQFPRRSGGPEFVYSDPRSLTSAASPAPSMAYSAPPPTAAQPYYAPQPVRRSSPSNTYSYESSRASSSPRTQATPSTPGAPPYYAAPSGALQPNPPRNDGRTPPPPASQSSSRPGLRINDLVSDNGPVRSATDADMLNMLNRRPM